MPETIDLDAYFQRIGYIGPRTATLETLAAIHFHHPIAIPFENLDPLLKRPVGLDLQALDHKMLRQGRGGWCFEHNLLLSHVLRALGFRVTGLAARVVWGAPEAAQRPRTHMLVRVDLPDGPYIADVGFGGLTLTAPVRLTPDIEQPTPHEVFRLVKADADFVLQARVQDTWKPLYSFELQPQLLPDYAVANWYLSNHPESPFVNNLMAARVTADRRYGLFNNKLSTHFSHGETQHRILTSGSELQKALETTFAIRMPDEAQLQAVLDRLIDPPPPAKT